MAKLFAFKLDVNDVEDLADDLDRLTPEELAAATVKALNDSIDSAYVLSRNAMLKSINLSDAYVQRKMEVEHATPSKPVATLTAFGGSAFTTSLSHYGALQLTTNVRWSNERILALGHKFEKWPGWTRRTGSAALGIPVNEKAAGKSVEVSRGRRKKMGPTFSIPGKKDNEGNPIIFRRNSADKLEALSGPSVYQLFSSAIPLVYETVADDLEQAVAEAAQQYIQKELR